MAGYDKSDYWSQKAAAAGYPARSVYKLQEINDKFRIISKDAVALDLGSSPGSWTSFLLRLPCRRVVSCDLNPLSKSVKGEALTFIQGDLNSKDIREAILEAGKYDAVLCDAAPLTTGNKTVDTARSEQLVEMAIWYAENTLKAGGGFAVKIFQNGAQRQFLDKMRLLFSEAKGFKPKACRAQSFETYLVGVGRKI